MILIIIIISLLYFLLLNKRDEPFELISDSKYLKALKGFKDNVSNSCWSCPDDFNPSTASVLSPYACINNDGTSLNAIKGFRYENNCYACPLGYKLSSEIFHPSNYKACIKI